MELEYKEYEKENAPLMVFLHGGGVSGWMWDEQIKYFSLRYHCIVPDLPAHGTSQNQHFSIKDSAEKIIELINLKRSEQPVIVIGFSLGAQILVNILSIAPGLINYAIINSALTRPMEYSLKLLKPLFKLSFPLTKMRSFAKLQSKVLYIQENQFEHYVKETTEITFDSFMQVMKENMSFQVPKKYSSSKSKILVTVGEKEKKMMHKSAFELVQKNSNSTGIMIPKVGHGISLANPNYFNKMLEDWVSMGNIPENAKLIEQ
ncbi:alpha/beta fold hydrolase [Paucisalibacillus sp. EB02]|uniref:alpha/beta fold hydrolase n=1 Tax=Paucisalibacillus sp. EB02 TaxID=1347087 RepID=UPI0005A8D312